MQLRLEQLRAATTQIIKQMKTSDILRSEIKKIFGVKVNVNQSLHQVIKEVNDLLLTPQYFNRQIDFSTSLAIKLSKHENDSCRLLASRVLPPKLAESLSHDKCVEVRYSVAYKASPKILDEMLMKWSNDDQLQYIAETRNLVKEELDSKMKSLRQWEGLELTDEWYHTQAKKLIQKYLNNIEYCWEELAVRQFANAQKTTAHVEIDEKKLYDTIMKIIEDREDERLEALNADPLKENPLKETLDWLRMGGHKDNEPKIQVLEFKDDLVKDLVESQLASVEYVSRFNKLFLVKEAIVPASLKKNEISESKVLTKVPVNAMCPEKTIRTIDERALDKYVRAWNDVQASKSADRIKIEWNYSQTSPGAITFGSILR